MKIIFLLMASIIGFSSLGFGAGASGEKLKWTEKVLAEFKKSPESKGVIVTLKNSSTLMISNLARTITVDLERSDKSYIYFLNRKELNLKEFASEAELVEKIKSYLPRVAVRNSFWLGKVWAQGLPVDFDRNALGDSIAKLIKLNVEKSLECDDLTNFEKSCNNFSSALLSEVTTQKDVLIKGLSFNSSFNDKKVKLLSTIKSNLIDINSILTKPENQVKRANDIYYIYQSEKIVQCHCKFSPSPFKCSKDPDEPWFYEFRKCARNLEQTKSLLASDPEISVAAVDAAISGLKQITQTTESQTKATPNLNGPGVGGN